MNTSAHQLIALLAPRSVAIIGASRDESRIGGRILYNVIRNGFHGKVYPVNPHADELQGLKCFPSASSIGASIDLAVIAVPPDAVQEATADCVRARVPAGIIITAGFAETSAEGALRQESIRLIAKSGGMRLLGPNCLGLMNTDPAVSLNATFGPQQAVPGNIAIASQSGAIGLLLLEYLSLRGAGISNFVSMGNKVDVSNNDLLEAWENDSRTNVIVLYLESVGNPERFLEIAERVSKKKPVIVFKAGKSKSGLRAAASHSAAIAGNSRSVEALMKKAGVVNASTLEELLDLACYFSESPAPLGRRMAIVTNGGGPAIALADAAEGAGLEVPVLPKETQDKLREFLPLGAAVQNPIDMLPRAGAEEYEKVVATIAESKSCDSIALLQIPIEDKTGAEITRRLPNMRQRFPSVRIVPIFMSGLEKGIRFPERVAPVLAKAYQYRTASQTPIEPGFCFPDDTISRLRAACSSSDTHSGWLSPDAVTELLQVAGIRTPQSRFVTGRPDEAFLESTHFPVVVKIISPQVLHKQDVGGVRLGVRSREELLRVLAEMNAIIASNAIADARLLVQEQIKGGVEAFIGAVREPEVGSVIVFGLGGTLVQLLDDVSAVISPLDRAEVEDELSQLHLNELLLGYRGSPAADREAFLETVQRIGALMDALPQIVELDLNPVLVLPGQQGICVPDARIRIARQGN